MPKLTRNTGKQWMSAEMSQLRTLARPEYADLIKIADRGAWYSDYFYYDSPVCYELVLAGPQCGSPQTV